MKGIELLINPNVKLDYDAQKAIVSYLNDSDNPIFTFDDNNVYLFNGDKDEIIIESEHATSIV